MTNLMESIAPPIRTLMGPGPSDVHPSVLEAMSRPTVGHLDPYFLEVMDQVQGMLRAVFGTENKMTLAISGTGSAGQETTIANLVEPGDDVLVCVNGVFGMRLAEMAERAGGNVSRVERPWGEVFTPEDLRDPLAAHHPKIVAIVMAETSTGAWQPLEEISKLVHEAGALLIVDTVTAVGGIPVEVDRWQLDAVYAGTQKCLSCPPGLAPITLNEAAMEKILNRKTKVSSWYLDLSLIANYWGSDRAYHHTAPINMVYGLHEALRLVLAEGLSECHARHRRNHLALKAGLGAVGISYATAAGHELPQLNAVTIPDGADDARIRKGLLEQFGIEIGAGLGAFKGRVWRIGLMGYASRPANVLLLLAALEQLLAAEGIRFEAGRSIAAANAAYADSGL